MTYEFPYEVGSEIAIYDDWENGQNYIGTAKLVEFLRQGRSFILEDVYPETDQIVYNWQEWYVQFGDSAPVKRKIRYIDTHGIANSRDDEDYDSEIDPKLSQDSFLMFDDKEIF